MEVAAGVATTAAVVSIFSGLLQALSGVIKAVDDVVQRCRDNKVGKYSVKVKAKIGLLNNILEWVKGYKLTKSTALEMVELNLRATTTQVEVLLKCLDGGDSIGVLEQANEHLNKILDIWLGKVEDGTENAILCIAELICCKKEERTGGVIRSVAELEGEDAYTCDADSFSKYVQVFNLLMPDDDLISSTTPVLMLVKPKPNLEKEQNWKIYVESTTGVPNQSITTVSSDIQRFEALERFTQGKAKFRLEFPDV